MSSTTSATEPWATNPLYLFDIPSDSFVVGEVGNSYSTSEGKTAKISGVSFTKSVVFANSGTETLEFNLPLGYQTFTGNLGLTDDSRKDADVDGTADVFVYVGANLVFGPQPLTYPDNIPFTIPINGATRVRIDVTGVDYNEAMCLCSAKFGR